jgi:hypothetical protein
MPTRKKSNLTNNKARKWKNVLASQSNEDVRKTLLLLGRIPY